MSKQSVCVAIAYRYGWSNAGWYIVAAGIDFDEVSEAAEEECESRGGKYGIAIYKHTGDEEVPVSYYPSSYGESHPSHNGRISLAESIGLHILGAKDEQLAELPSWLLRAIDHEQKVSEAVAGSFSDAIKRTWTTQPKEPT